MRGCFCSTSQLVEVSSLCPCCSVFNLSFSKYPAPRSHLFPDSMFINHPKIYFKNFRACFYIGTCRFFKMQLWSPLEHHLTAKGLNNCGLFHYPCREHENFKELYITGKKPHLMRLKDVEVRRLES